MNEDNFVAADTDDLDAFTDLMEGRAEEAKTEEPKQEEVEQEETPVEDVPDESEEADEADDAPREEKPKGRFQERITELTAKQKETERKLEEALAELKKDKAPVQTPTETVKTELVKPTPDDKNEDGTDKYPLGDFDPNFTVDLVKYTNAQERAIYAAEAAEQAKEKEEAAAREALTVEWQTKVEAVQDKHEDFLEKTQSLEETFRDMDPDYGNFLASTIMAMDAGPDVLYYLAENKTEAKAIAALGPVKATIALGRLEATFLKDAEPATKAPRVTSAPTPAPLNKGVKTALATPDDTDDLDAFSNKFFAKK